jgi:hypothetical protein
LINLRRRLRSANAPFMRQLDSLRESLGLSLEPCRRAPRGRCRRATRRPSGRAPPRTM